MSDLFARRSPAILVSGSSSIVLVVPPFSGLTYPSLAAHLLQSCAKLRGHALAVCYANLSFACQFGEVLHEILGHGSNGLMLGERLFAGTALGSATSDQESIHTTCKDERKALGQHLSWTQYVEATTRVTGWVEEVAGTLAGHADLRVLGASTTFQQTCASLAILRAVKRRRPDVVTLLGGANCEGDMAEGLAGIAPWVDHIFSGPSEESFPAFLDDLAKGVRSQERIIRGTPVADLDALPRPCYDEYYDQLERFLPDSELKKSGQIWLPYETSRGCWWGAKHHCTFCGLNGETMRFREKSPDRVIADLQVLLARHPTRLVSMVDNIMPHSYFRTLLPRLATELPDVQIFYEQKSNLSFEQVGALKRAGVGLIQPGIESLSSPLLALMDKGVTASQNLALLRYARMWRVSLNWNLLYGFPGDRAEWYREILELMPLIPHLEPPRDLCRLGIHRFSPYFARPQDYGLRNIRPLTAYQEVFPANSDLARIAYFHQADYESEMWTQPELIESLRQALARWQSQWQQRGPSAPVLAVISLGRDRYLLLDTRRLPDQPVASVIGTEQARMALLGQPHPRHTELAAWALQRRIVIARDGRLVPLSIAESSLYQRLSATRENRPHLPVISVRTP